MSVLIGADIVPSNRNQNLFNSADLYSLIGSDLIKIIDGFDYKIFNLETPLAKIKTPIKKGGTAFCSSLETVNSLSVLGIDLVSLANNHIMDQGEAGLFSTIKTLEKKKISYVGIGDNLEQASKPFYFKIQNKTFGVYSCVEHEFSIAGEESAGANPYDSLESFEHVQKMSEKSDFLIVLYHGGKEYYQYPSPRLQKVCRKFVEQGADLVICQHSHCIGCEEKYLTGTIVYGQGNFLFDSCKNPKAKESLLVKVEDDFSIDYIPLVKKGVGVCVAGKTEKESIIESFKRRSNEIQVDGFVQSEYEKFAKDKLKDYLLTLSGYKHSFVKRLINKMFGYRLSNFFARSSFSEEDLLAMRNFIECEAHQELFLTGLKMIKE